MLLVAGSMLLVAGTCAAAGVPNWSGKFSSCDRHGDLLIQTHVDLGVKISAPNPILAREFEKAMDFWARIVDFDWHEDQSHECSVQLVQGTKDLFERAAIAARAQEPDRSGFEGWVAFNPTSRLTEHEMFQISVHEIGHLLGLHHNPSASSVMFFFNLDDSTWLDASDLKALALRHALRSGLVAGGSVAATRVLMP